MNSAPGLLLCLLGALLLSGQVEPIYVPLRCTCLKVTEAIKKPLSDIDVIEKGHNCENDEIIVTLKTKARHGQPAQVCLNPTGEQAKELRQCLNSSLLDCLGVHEDWFKKHYINQLCSSADKFQTHCFIAFKTATDSLEGRLSANDVQLDTELRQCRDSAARISRNTSHPNSHLFTWLRSGKHLCCLSVRAEAQEELLTSDHQTTEH